MPRCRGIATVTETPSASKATGSAPRTSPRPPALAKGTHSAATIRTFIRSIVCKWFFSLSFAIGASPTVLGSVSTVGALANGRLRLSVNQFSCPMRCPDDSLDQGQAQTPVFQLEDTVDSAAGRCSDDVFKLGRMLTGFENHAGSAEDHLRRQLCCGFTRQAHFHAGVDKGFDDDVNECRSAGAQTGNGVHMFLVENKRASDGIENLSCLSNVVRGGELARGNCSHPLFDKARRVRHGPDHGNGSVDNCFHEPDRHARCNGYDNVVWSEVIGNLAEDFFDSLRFYAEKDQVRFADGFGIRQRRLYFQFRPKLLQPLLVRCSCDELLPRDDIGIDHSGDERLAEFTGAQYGNSLVLKHAFPFR